MKDKTRCKKCGQKLPSEYPEFLYATVIVPEVRHAAKAVTLEGNGFGSYTNTERVDFRMESDHVLDDCCIVHLDGTFFVVPLNRRIGRVEEGDTLSFEKGTIAILI